MNEFNKEYEAGIYFKKEENGDLLVDLQNVVDMWKIALVLTEYS
jgi:hypothetical protein